MDLAMKKAKDTGVGWVTCRGKPNSVNFHYVSWNSVENIIDNFRTLFDNL